MPFAHVPTKEMNKIRGASSAVFLKVLEVFWSKNDDFHNFERTGVMTRGRIFRFKYGFMIVDEKAEKEILGIKGTGGLRCCVSCLNCVRTKRRIRAGSGLVSFTEADMSKFQRNTPEILSAALDYLDEQKGVLSKTKFEELEIQLGIVHADCVLLYSPYREMVNFPAARYTDWFHDLLASGGVYQLLANEVVLDVLEKTRLSLGDIDGFQVGIRLPEGTPLSKTFFADRVVKKRGAHLKCFATEAISAVFVLSFLFVCVINDSAEFTQQARLCALARESLEVLLAGDQAVRLADRLDSVLEQLQVLLLALYPWCDIPKVHLMRHIKDGLTTFQKNMACGSGERLHRRSKELARHSFKEFQETVLVREIKACFDDFGEATNFKHTVLEGSPRELVVLGVARTSWASARVGYRRWRAKDIVQWVLDGQCLGRVRGIVEHEGRPFAAVACLSPAADSTFSCAVLHEAVVECAVLMAALPYIEVRKDIFKVLTRT